MLALADDIIYGDVILRSVGNRKIEIENFLSIMDYQAEQIVLKGKKQIIRIQGENLVIQSYLEQMLVLSGRVQMIEFQVCKRK